MDLQHYLEILKRRAFVIIVVMIMAVALVSIAGFLNPPEYTARATVRVLLDVGLTDFIMRADYSTRLMNTYVEVVSTTPILQKAVERVSNRSSSLTASSLKRSIEVEIIPDTELISIAVRYRDPSIAQELANNLATLLVEYSQNIYMGSSKSTRQIIEEQVVTLGNELDSDRQQLAKLLARAQTSSEISALTRQIELKEDAYGRLLDRYESARLNEAIRANSITVIAPATLPSRPSNALGLQDILLAAIVGLSGGIGLALILENLDTRIYSTQQLEALSPIPVLGVVPNSLLFHDNPGTGSFEANEQRYQEAYRLLSSNLQTFSKHSTPLQTLLITSAVPGEGKILVAINLARMLADQGKAVFLVESDMRHPVFTEIFDVKKRPVLSGLLAEPGTLNNGKFEKVYHPAKQSGLSIIPSGPVMNKPAALLASPAMEELLTRLRLEGEMTLVTAAEVLGLADTSVLASKVDGILLVVKQGYSRREQLHEALKQLQAAQAHVIGIVFVQRGTRNRIYG